ncbi:MAG: YraN family protein [Xanthomonadaceae bacterium]|nr:YraN family protein [Xanthomonadaceae bacterium]MDE1885120.1 YraN family protein [Xanthomonadaceae bacterium]MDE2084317.1 YraN family protein [Xanthomonadaceae bacterium]
MGSARGTGAAWESVAEAHLQQSGLRTLARNFVCRLGEIDLVMADRDCTVFVEVRFRHAAAHGGGVASVGAGKRAKLLRAAQVWLLAHPRRASRACRFDVVGCSGTPQQPQFDWIRNAFETC